MFRSFALGFVATILVAGLAFAEPGLEVKYFSGVPLLELEGSYPNTHYTIWRATESGGPFVRMTDLNTLCLGPCYGSDFEAEPGRTYWYRFDLVPAEGRPVSFGPYRVTIPQALARRVGVRVFPNPGSALTRIELHLAGAPTDPPFAARATLHDLQGRTVRTIHDGPLGRGLTRLTWDGRGGDGATLRPESYFLRFASPLGTAVARVIRVR